MDKGYIISTVSLDLFSQWLKSRNYSHIFILVDENTRTYCLPFLLKEMDFLGNSHVIQIASGENEKSLVTCELVWSELLRRNADRNSSIINLGGGALSDLGGFAASVFKRGIRFINVPTTLIGMIDAAFGGKTAINFKTLKNQIGLFAKPEMIVVCTKFLATLAQQDVMSGFAEMLKYGLTSDRELWEKLIHLDAAELKNLDSHLIESCLNLKNSVVQQDFHEKNYRKILNFGHTMGHALESLSFGRNRLSHGEAVVHGMLFESILSNQSGLLSDNELSEIKSVVDRYYMKLKIQPDDFEKLYEIMSFDKKNKNSVVNFTLLKSIGAAKIDNYIAKNEILKSLDRFNKL